MRDAKAQTLDREAQVFRTKVQQLQADLVQHQADLEQRASFGDDRDDPATRRQLIIALADACQILSEIESRAAYRAERAAMPERGPR